MSNFTPQQIEEFLQEFFDVAGARQYVGARYVPIFGRADETTIEWDDLAPYEPLTVVMHLGISYVSRRYVPAGIDITNTDYWVETYRFNAQVEQYRQEVLGFQDQIDDLHSLMTNDYVPFPDELHYSKYGTQGQVLSTLADGSTKWEDPIVPSDEQAEQVITAWLDDHPEATTTVTDGSITNVKIANGTIHDEKLYPYGVRNDYPMLMARIAEISEKVTGSISLANAINLNTALGYNTLFINWQSGELGGTGSTAITGIVCIPCLPSSTYSFASNSSRARFVAGCSASFPQVGDTLQQLASNNGQDTLAITTNSTAKYITLWYWIDSQDTIPLATVTAGLTCTGPTLEAKDDVARSGVSTLTALTASLPSDEFILHSISEAINGTISLNGAINVNTLLGYSTLFINWQTGVLGGTTTTPTTGLICIPCEPNSTYTFASPSNRPRFVCGCSPTLPEVGTTFTVCVNNNGGSTLSITTDATAHYLTLWYWISNNDTIPLATVTAGLSCVGPTYTAVDKVARLTQFLMQNAVCVSPNGTYQTITAGIAAVSAGGTVFVLPGTYEEQIDTRAKEVNIVGLDKYTCILKDTSGMYATPPIEIAKGSIQNMTIIETGEDSTPSSPGTNPTLAYCIHADFDQEANGTLYISNCILRCNKRAAIGCGVRSGFSLIIENCDIWSGVQEDTGHDPRGAIYIHTGAAGGQAFTPAKVRLWHNEINCDDELTLCFENYSGIGFTVESVCNMVYSAINGKTDAVIEDVNRTQFAWGSSDSTINNNPRSFGNNVSLLNA